MKIHELLTTDDARVWAKEFVQRVRDHPEIPTDAATMEGWFANAMCAARDLEVKRRRARLIARLRPDGLTDAQKELQKKHGNPATFEQAVWRAHGQLFATTDEAVTAIAKYRQEWFNAGDVDRQPPSTVDEAQEV